MTASLLDLLNREKALIDEINRYDDDIEVFKEKITKLAEERQRVEMKLKSIRSCLASYVEKNLIKLPNDDPFKSAEG